MTGGRLSPRELTADETAAIDALDTGGGWPARGAITLEAFGRKIPEP